jgi:putative ABC transport system substrate-binding protein
VELSPIGLRDTGEIERGVTAFARSANGGLIVTPSALTLVHRAAIIALAARHKLPAIYGDRHFVTAGGLISYGPDRINQYRQAAAYIDRIVAPHNALFPSYKTPRVHHASRRRGARACAGA